MNIGIIGTGLIANNMAYTLTKMDNVKAYAIASRDINKANSFKDKYQMTKAYGSYEELMIDNNVDLIYIATPHSHHHKNAMMALQHHKPILVEKSFTVNYIQAKEILDYAKKHNIFVAEAIWTRYLPSRKIIDEILTSNIIGKVTSLSCNLGYKIDHIDRIVNPNLAGGALLDVGVYPINFASMFLGNDIIDIQTTCVKNEAGVDLRNSMIFTYKNSVLASLHSDASSITDQYGHINGDKGYIIAKKINNIDAIEVYDHNRTLIKSYDIPKQITGLEYQIEACIKAIKNNQIEVKEMPHDEILEIMKQMDTIRSKWQLKYPFE